MNKLISVIIPAHNEEKYIVPTLKSVLSSSYDNFEIIVVCNGCNDKTAENARLLKDSRIKVIETKKPSISISKNLGIKHANGDIFVFLDADTLISDNALTLIHKNTDKNTVGTLKIYPDNKKIIARFMMFLKNLIMIVVFFYPTSNGIIFTSKEMFNKLGGFDETLRKQEDGKYIRTGRKKGKFKFLRSAHVITSMRRYEKKGYFSIPFYWLKHWLLSFFNKHEKGYEVIR